MTKSPSHDIIKYHVGGRYVALRILFCDDDSKILAQLQKYVCEYFEKGKLKRPEMKVYKEHHGVGLKSVKQAVQRYHGVSRMYYSNEENRFHSVIHLTK